ncbi:YggT family protein [Serpentinicella alkaliphila]|uniref:YggT family protein n=1 Tax=Serpentinicella alkaliphila TaxID=1734049 RepID=A0A4R2T9Q2_9FIRM|nr:YggT family protein [Serpentinicella alkaliphila]QUH26116.1 YggT family protein [Serpentinicella alkaliphila]TCP98436.1 YggT family protein [Serpentinicella alkaliphila]
MFNSSTVIQALIHLSRIIEFLVLIRVLFSWIRPNPRSAIVQFVYNMTEPILEPIRRLIYGLGYNGMIDFSPIIAMFLVRFIFNRLIFLLR